MGPVCHMRPTVNRTSCTHSKYMCDPMSALYTKRCHQRPGGRPSICIGYTICKAALPSLREASRMTESSSSLLYTKWVPIAFCTFAITSSSNVYTLMQKVSRKAITSDEEPFVKCLFLIAVAYRSTHTHTLSLSHRLVCAGRRTFFL